MGVFDQIWLSHVLPPNKSPPATEYVTSSQATPPNCSGSLPGVIMGTVWFIPENVSVYIACIIYKYDRFILYRTATYSHTAIYSHTDQNARDATFIWGIIE